MVKKYAALAAALLLIPAVLAADYVEIGASGTLTLNRPFCGS